VDATSLDPTARLSALQRDILCRLLAHEHRADQNGQSDPRCTAIKDLRGPGPHLAADSAAFSRSIRRLASRGLVLLCNFANGVRSGPNAGKVTIDPTDKNARADHIMLTPLGRAAARSVGIPTETAAGEPKGSPAPTSGPPAPPARTCEFDERPALPRMSWCKECWEGLKAARGFQDPHHLRVANARADAETVNGLR
jgi:hypothetical protein